MEVLEPLLFTIGDEEKEFKDQRVWKIPSSIDIVNATSPALTLGVRVVNRSVVFPSTETLPDVTGTLSISVRMFDNTNTELGSETTVSGLTLSAPFSFTDEVETVQFSLSGATAISSFIVTKATISNLRFWVGNSGGTEATANNSTHYHAVEVNVEAIMLNLDDTIDILEAADRDIIEVSGGGGGGSLTPAQTASLGRIPTVPNSSDTNKVWKTDGSATPGWRDDAMGSGGANDATARAAAAAAQATADAALPLAGGTMTGKLTLDGLPTTALHAATKGYVDSKDANIVDGSVTTDKLANTAVTAAKLATDVSGRLLPTFPSTGSRDNKIPKFDGNTLGWEVDAGGTGGGADATARAAAAAAQATADAAAVILSGTRLPMSNEGSDGDWWIYGGENGTLLSILENVQGTWVELSRADYSRIEIDDLRHLTRDLHTPAPSITWIDALDSEGDMYQALSSSTTPLTDANFNNAGASLEIATNASTQAYVRLPIGVDHTDYRIVFSDGFARSREGNLWTTPSYPAAASTTYQYWRADGFTNYGGGDVKLQKRQSTLDSTFFDGRLDGKALEPIDALQHLTRDIHVGTTTTTWSNVSDSDADLFWTVPVAGEITLTDANFNNQGASITIPASNTPRTTYVFVRLPAATNHVPLRLMQGSHTQLANTWGLAADEGVTIPSGDTYQYWLAEINLNETAALTIQLQIREDVAHTRYDGTLGGEATDQINDLMEPLQHLTRDLHVNHQNPNWENATDDLIDLYGVRTSSEDTALTDANFGNNGAVILIASDAATTVFARLPVAANYLRYRVIFPNGLTLTGNSWTTVTGPDETTYQYWRVGSVDSPGNSIVKAQFHEVVLEDTTYTGSGSIPTGGTTGQALVKSSGDSYDVEWGNVAAGDGGSSGGTTSPTVLYEDATAHTYDHDGFREITLSRAPAAGTVLQFTLTSAPNSLMTNTIYMPSDAFLALDVPNSSATGYNAGWPSPGNKAWLGVAPAAVDTAARITYSVGGNEWSHLTFLFVRRQSNTLMDVLYTFDGVDRSSILKIEEMPNGAAAASEGGGDGGSSTFTGLTDTPSAFTSQGGKVVAVNSAADALEFVDAPSGTDATARATAAAAELDAAAAQATADAALSRSGGTMTGKITLDGAPTVNLHAATKKYVDDNIGDFISLTDTPADYTGEGGKYLAVNSGASAIEFVDAPSGGGSSGGTGSSRPSITKVSTDTTLSARNFAEVPIGPWPNDDDFLIIGTDGGTIRYKPLVRWGDIPISDGTGTNFSTDPAYQVPAYATDTLASFDLYSIRIRRRTNSTHLGVAFNFAEAAGRFTVHRIDYPSGGGSSSSGGGGGFLLEEIGTSTNAIALDADTVADTGIDMPAEIGDKEIWVLQVGNERYDDLSFFFAQDIVTGNGAEIGDTLDPNTNAGDNAGATIRAKRGNSTQSDTLLLAKDSNDNIVISSSHSNLDPIITLYKIASGGSSSSGGSQLKDLDTLPDVASYEVGDLIAVEEDWYKLGVTDETTANLFAGEVGRDVFNNTAGERWRGISSSQSPNGFSTDGEFTANPDNTLTLLLASSARHIRVAMKRSVYEAAKGSTFSASDHIAIRVTMADGSTTDEAVLAYYNSYERATNYIIWQHRHASDNYNLYSEAAGNEVTIEFFTTSGSTPAATTTPLFTHTAGLKHWLLWPGGEDPTEDGRTALNLAQANAARLDALDMHVDGVVEPLHSLTYNENTALLAPLAGSAGNFAVSQAFNNILTDDLLVIDWRRCDHLNHHDEYVVPGSDTTAGRMYLHPRNFDNTEWNGEFVYALDRAIQDNGSADPLNSWIVGSILYSGSTLTFGLHLQQGGTRTNRNLMPQAGFSLTLRIYRNSARSVPTSAPFKGIELGRLVGHDSNHLGEQPWTSLATGVTTSDGPDSGYSHWLSIPMHNYLTLPTGLGIILEMSRTGVTGQFSQIFIPWHAVGNWDGRGTSYPLFGGSWKSSGTSNNDRIEVRGRVNAGRLEIQAACGGADDEGTLHAYIAT